MRYSKALEMEAVSKSVNSQHELEGWKAMTKSRR